MADEQYRWLNRDAAERLLSGDPLEAVDPHVRARADRLAEALGALAAEAAPEPEHAQDPELPGEEAALAAFRIARIARTGPAAHSGDSGGAADHGRGSRPHTTASPTADAGLVHLGRPVRTPAGPAGPGGRRGRWGRPVRFGLVAAVAAGMLGGVTVMAGGALSAFHVEEPEPSATVSAGGSPDRTLMSPSPNTGKGDDRRGAWGGATPDPSPHATSKGGAPSGDGTGGTDEDKGSGAGGQGDESTRQWRKNLLSACRDVRDGKELDADRRRGLEDAAGARGKGRLKRYCEGVLAGGTGNPGSSGKAKRWGGTGAGTGTGTSDGGGRTGGGDKAARTGNGSDDDDDAHHGKGNGRRHGNGKGRHGSGNGKAEGDGTGHRHGNGNGNGNGKGGESKGHQGGKGNNGGGGGSGGGHRGQLAAVTPIGFAAAPALTRTIRTYPS
ncbi:hypothetical protein [Streptomyces sp. VNUA24]|uniref:hypothetical protein n=1 Tax=Streptomyces sp. VNUA24 TaxID=3031131 RepID=UPI0023B82966|nr:hypothetical protein [Streptomyces sp. VNUA24]WEH15684.1 hypothetical protein PYR72_18960 [Streptomyces sp. VNUA24]